MATYPIAPGERLNTQFTVTANGIPVPVVNEVRTYCHFSFDGEVEIEVTGLAGHTLSPVDYGIVPSHDDGTNKLVIFADPMEVDPPRPGDLNVIDFAAWNGTLQEALDRLSFDPLFDVVYVGPGAYNLSSNLKIPSDAALYLAGGAKLNFTSGGVQFAQVDNSRLFGRGLPTGDPQPGEDGVTLEFRLPKNTWLADPRRFFFVDAQ